ncbi:hypothetical protein [Ornithinibacillus californiensis]|uniref:hypothetical protein n=1 Tax=Ornithinibacillus californiensis TaxID=161536 RepID=UPI00064DAFB5|nr:hypothetical protein [Ornithinibacillus californiensis]
MKDTKAEKKDQENELMNILKELNQHAKDEDLPEPVNVHVQELKENDDLTILNLPPRKDVHGQKKNRTHLKIRRPLLRLTVVTLLLVVLVVLMFFGEELIKF